MVAPPDYALTILIGVNDVSNNCNYEDLAFDDNLKTPSYFKFTLQNSAVTPAFGDIVEVIAKTLPDTPTIFYGYIMELEGYKRDNGIAKEWKIDAADMKIRLQNAVLPYLDLVGTDAEIIADLFENAYPDLSDVFDWTTGIDSFVDSMNLNVNNDNLLDVLNKMAEKTGANVGYGRATGNGQLITFDPAVDSIADDAFFPAAIPRFEWQYDETGGVQATGGNPTYNAYATGTTPTPPAYDGHSLTMHMATFPDTRTITNIRFDYYLDCAGGSVTFRTGTPSTNTTGTVDAAWHSIDWLVDVDPTATWAAAASYTVLNVEVVAPNGTAYDFRLDNFEVITSAPFATGEEKEGLTWGNTPEPAPFNLDIDSGDEFAFDITDWTGGVDNFNSVIVVGGKEDVAHDKVYSHDGENNEIQLAAHVKSIAAFKNTGSDASITWTPQALGVYGTDELLSAGGTKDVLYDAKNHYLIFNSAPSNLRSSVKVTGFVEKPLRVLVENVQGNAPVLAQPIYDDTITSQEDAIALGNSILNQKNSLNRVTFKTFEPYLKPGQEISITDSARGLAKVMVIQRVSTQWLGASGNAEFTVDCGDIDNTGLDSLIADIDKKAGKNAPEASLTTTSVDVITDSNGLALTDSNGALLYEPA